MTLPAWAVVKPKRQAHVERVAELLERWAKAMQVPARERVRWLKAAYLHDALRDEKLASSFAHGPLAAERAAREGETDRGVLDAVRYHTIGYAHWDDVGRMLYLADYLEPGRKFDQDTRRAWAARVPGERDQVLKEVAGARLERVIRSSWPLPPETVEFWNSLVDR